MRSLAFHFDPVVFAAELAAIRLAVHPAYKPGKFSLCVLVFCNVVSVFSWTGRDGINPLNLLFTVHGKGKQASRGDYRYLAHLLLSKTLQATCHYARSAMIRSATHP